MSFEQRGGALGTDSKKLLLTVEEEVAARKDAQNEYGERPYFVLQFLSDNGGVLTAVGTRHTRSEIELSQIKDQYHASGAEILIHEGRPIRDVFPGMSDEDIWHIPASEVAKRQEQAFLAWIAFCEGKPTRSWDLPLAEQLIVVSQTRGVAIVMEWLVVEALNKIYASQIPPTAMAFEALLGVVLQRDDRAPLERAGFNFSQEAINAVCLKYFGFSIEVLARRWSDSDLREDDWSRCRGLSDPAYSGETNGVLRDINVLRDRHAIDVIAEAKQEFSSVFVLGGGSHVRTWKPALTQLYQ